MHSPTLLRWVLSASGLWLVQSPFLLFSQEMLSSSAAIIETGILMIAGVLALVIAGFNDKWPNIRQAGLGIALGIALIAAPLLVGFTTNALATWNAGLTGLVIIVIVLFALSKHLGKNIN